MKVYLTYEIDPTDVETIIRLVRAGATQVQPGMTVPTQDSSMPPLSHPPQPSLVPAGTQTPPTDGSRELRKEKKVIGACSPRVKEFIIAADLSFPGGADFTMPDLAEKIQSSPDIQAVTTHLRKHPKAKANLAQALVAWRRNLARPEKRLGVTLFESIDDESSPKRYRVNPLVSQALAELKASARARLTTPGLPSPQENAEEVETSPQI